MANVTYTKVVKTVADLRTLTPILSGEVVMTECYATDVPESGGAWKSVISTPGTYVHNGGTIVVPNGGNGAKAWLRVIDTPGIRPEWFGAKRDNVTNDTAVFNTAAAWAQTNGDQPLLLSPGYYRVIEFTSPVDVIGAGQGVTHLDAFTSGEFVLNISSASVENLSINGHNLTQTALVVTSGSTRHASHVETANTLRFGALVGTGNNNQFTFSECFLHSHGTLYQTGTATASGLSATVNFSGAPDLFALVNQKNEAYISFSSESGYLARKIHEVRSVDADTIDVDPVIGQAGLSGASYVLSLGAGIMIQRSADSNNVRIERCEIQDAKGPAIIDLSLYHASVENCQIESVHAGRILGRVMCYDGATPTDGVGYGALELNNYFEGLTTGIEVYSARAIAPKRLVGAVTAGFVDAGPASQMPAPMSQHEWTYNNLAELRAATVVVGRVVRLLGYSTFNDDGGGDFVGMGSSPGTYVHDGGTVLVASGADGSRAWVRQSNSTGVRPEWFGAKRDAITNDQPAIQAAVDWCKINWRSGGTVQFSSGVYICSSTVNLGTLANIVLKGAGRRATELRFTHTGRGIASINTINSNAYAPYVIEDMSITCNNASNTDGGIVDVGGSHWAVNRVFVNGFKYGAILDQSEVAIISDSELAAQNSGGASVWIVNGPEYTVGANPDYTNRITVQRCSISQVAGRWGIVDDGGNTHSFIDNNYNGCDRHIRACAVVNLVIQGGEHEASIQPSVHFSQLDRLGTTKGGCSAVLINGGEFVPSGAMAAIQSDSAVARLTVVGAAFAGSGGVAKITGASVMTTCNVLGCSSTPDARLVDYFPPSGIIQDPNFGDAVCNASGLSEGIAIGAAASIADGGSANIDIPLNDITYDGHYELELSVFARNLTNGTYRQHVYAWSASRINSVLTFDGTPTLVNGGWDQSSITSTVTLQNGGGAGTIRVAVSNTIGNGNAIGVKVHLDWRKRIIWY